MALEFSDVVSFNLAPLLQGQMRVATLKSVYNSFVIGPRGLECQTDQKEIMHCESSDLVRFDLGPPFKVKRRQPNIKVLVIKRPARDACLCMGDLQAAPALPAPHFVFLITL